MGDEHECHTAVGLQPSQEGEDLRLGRDVQGRRRLVRDEQVRIPCQRRRDRDALPHPAGELERVAVGDRVRGQPHLAKAARDLGGGEGPVVACPR
ncbi:hypothetical protein GCM10022232_64140 [Streptomyces plumbiresistens]|uniref:Uncharacterized protein n=1 Tax=Streptomyces plumbiresistens TaxID=511811 RepID=A0ABP7SKR3_9ACTN